MKKKKRNKSEPTGDQQKTLIIKESFEYNEYNRILAFYESIVLNDKVDQFVKRDQILNEINSRLDSYTINKGINVAHIIDLAIQALKTDEFKAVLKTDQFKELYHITNALPPIRLGGWNQFYEVKNWRKIKGTISWKKFIAIDILTQISDALNSIHPVQRLLLREFFMRSFQDFIDYDFLPSQIFDLIAFHPKPNEKILVILHDKCLECKLSRFSEQSIRAHLCKYLIDDEAKSEFIEETVNYTLSLKESLFLHVDEPERYIGLIALYRSIYENECALLNYFIDQANQNTAVFRSWIDRNPSLCFDITVFMELLIIKEEELQGFIGDNYAFFWQNFADYLLEKEEKTAAEHPIKEMEKHVVALYKLLPKGKELQELKEKPRKEKLPCDNYLYAALLYEKKLKEDLEFLSLCREAAEKYCSKKGKEFSGEQLANVFYQKLKQFGSFEEFCKPEYNGERMNKLKEKINWQG